MDNKYTYDIVSNADDLIFLKKQWRNMLTSPQDGMWEAFRNQGRQWILSFEAEDIGYASVNEAHQLIQFYLTPQFLTQGSSIFNEFITRMNIKNGIVGTNNPIFLSLALHNSKQVSVHTLLFRHSYDHRVAENLAEIKTGVIENLDHLVKFYHYSVGAPIEWLTGYIKELIEKQEVFYIENQSGIIGTCEVRTSLSAPEYSDIGMVVSPDYRCKGYSAYLLGQAKQIAKKSGKIPICSCEKDNVGSLKSIHKCGFYSLFQLLSVDFK